MRRGWLVVFLVGACGNHGNARSQSDAPVGPADAAPIGPVDPMCPVLGAAGDVTVEPPTVTGQLTIVVSDNTGATLSRMDGVASGGAVTVSVPACGMVTVFRQNVPANDVTSNDAVTWTGVQPGDHLVDPRVMTSSVAVTIDGAQNVTGANLYNAYFSCASSATLQEGNDTAAKVAGGTLQCTASASAVAATIVASDAPMTEYASGSAPISGGAATVTFGAPAPAAATMHVDISGVAEVAEISVGTHQVPGPGLDQPYVVTTVDANGSDTVGADADAGSGAGTLVVALEGGVDGSPFFQTTELVQAYDALPASVAVAASDLLPPVTFTESTTEGRFAAALATPTPISGSLAVGTISFTYGSTAVTWQMIAPANTPALYLPALPADLVPADHDGFFMKAVDIYDIPALSYADARAHLDELPASPTTQMRIAHAEVNLDLAR
jgi:hypothetical protein